MSSATQKIIAGLNTSTNWAGVGLYVGATDKTYEHSWYSKHNHARELIPAMLELCKAADISPQQFTHIAVALGPGRFSATRTGISSAIGLALPKNLPIIGVPTHQIEVFPHIHHATAETPLFVALSAGRGEVIWYQYNGDFEVVATDLSRAESFARTAGETGLVCGDFAPHLASHLKKYQILTPTEPTSKPADLIALAKKRIASGEITKFQIKPIYAREPSITLNLNLQ